MVDGFIKLVFLFTDDIENEISLFFQFRIPVFGSGDYRLAKTGQEFSFDIQNSSVTACAAQETSKHVASSLVGRHDSVGNHKCHGTDMVCDDTDGNIRLLILFVSHARNPAYMVTERFHCINIKNGIHVLYNTCQTLQSHSGIDILLFQFAVIAVSVVIKLGEYVVPDFHVTVALTAYCTVRFAAAVFFAAVIVDLGTWSARSGTVLPEIVFFSKLVNPVCRDAHLLVPDIKGFLIIHVNGRIQAVWIKSYRFGQEFPGPVDRLSFKIISEGKVPEHLEKGTVSCGLSYVFDITGTDTFLACSHPSSRRNLLSGKVWF